MLTIYFLIYFYILKKIKIATCQSDIVPRVETMWCDSVTCHY